jgi:excisionase family DNA binding protein
MPGRVSEAERQFARYKWMTTRQVAERLGISQEHVRALIGEKALRAMDVSRPNAKAHEYRVREEWCDEFEAARTDGPTAAA